MTELLRTDAHHHDFIDLVKHLNADLAHRDGEEHSFYAQYNQLDAIKNAIVLYLNQQPVACGAMKKYNDTTMEIKRMYTLESSRGKGLASIILAELEKWAAELGYQKCILETGIRQPEAIHLYEKNGYHLIANYDQYIGVSDSRCFEKHLI